MLGIDLAEALADERKGDAIGVLCLSVEDYAWSVVARSGNHSRNPAIVGYCARSHRARFLVDHHDRAWLRRRGLIDGQRVEVLGTVGVAQHNVSRVAIEEDRVVA